MKRIADNGFYEIVYENQKYEYLMFVRIDHICEVSYITLKNVLTNEMFTFEQELIKKIRKRMHILPGTITINKNHVADSETYSLY